MKMYQIDDMYVALDERGRQAPALITHKVMYLWGDPETFLRLAYTMLWVPEHLNIEIPEGLAPLWERPDPHFSCWECGNLLVVRDGTGRYAPTLDEPDHDWRTPRDFMLRNAEGTVHWTDTLPDRDLQESHLTAMLSEQGRKLWEVPEPA